MFEHDVKGYEKKFASFGWEAIVIDGHNIGDIINALATAKKSKKKLNRSKSSNFLNKPGYLLCTLICPAIYILYLY